ncbi:hypothetical protein ACKWTF_015466 [Chironomus riparius]
MNAKIEADIELENHLEKCRCCFRILEETDKFVNIDEIVQRNFYDLTQIELITSTDFSAKICSFCQNDLHVFSNFRTSLITNQLKLYSHIQSIQVHDFTKPDNKKFHFESSNQYTDLSHSFPSNVKIKTEKEDPEDIFVDCETIIEEKAERSRKRNQTLKPKKCCEICGSSVNNYRRHVLKVHLHVKNYFCDLCGFASFFRCDLEQHMKVHVKKSIKQQQTFYCESCGLEFNKKFHLNAHVRAKHTEKVRSHLCHICNKAFFSTENLKKHVESHNDKDMPCEFCGKLFSCINNLRTHLYYHSDPKFICDVEGCGKKFYMRKRLRAHMKTHANQKDHVCTYCDKRYFSQNDLNRHIFSIHQKLRFFCEEPGCHGNFSRREYYKKHAMTHHQNIGTERLELLLQKVRDAVPIQRAPN